MTRKEAERQIRQVNTLRSLGFTVDEAETLRRISLTLRRWYELECGDSNTYGSWAIERDENGDGPPYMVHHYYDRTAGRGTTRTRIADREKGAIKRLRAIVDARNTRIDDDIMERLVAADFDGSKLPANLPPKFISYYLQTDPRGCSLYIIRPDDVPAGADVSAYYTRGIAVY